MSTLGEKIRLLRRRAGLSQRALAEGLVTKSMISQIETDKLQPSADLLTRIAAKLQVRPEQLLPVKQEDQERLACYKQAQAFLSLGHFADALPLLTDCLRDPHPAWPLLLLTYQTACCHQQLGDFAAARKLYEKALRHAVCEENGREVIRLYVRLGEVAQKMGQLELAVVEWKRAERELAAHPAPEDEPWLPLDVCLSLASGLRTLGGSQEALQMYRRAERLLPAVPEQTRRRADVLQGIGLVLEKLEQQEEAERYLTEAEVLYRTAKDWRTALLTRLTRGRLLGKTGRQQEALAELTAGLQEAKDIGSSKLLVRAYCELGQVRRLTGEREAAVSLLQKGLDVPCTCRVERGLTFLALAGLHGDAGCYRDALTAAGQALELLQETKEELLAVCQLLTDLYKRQEDYRQASLWAEKADELVAKWYSVRK